jgi:hypothetical protein
MFSTISSRQNTLMERFVIHKIYCIQRNSRYTAGTIRKRERIVRSSQIIIISLSETGISVAVIQGIVEVNIRTCEMLNILMIKRVLSGAPATTRTGRYISARPRNAAFAAKSGSGICKSSVTG